MINVPRFTASFLCSTFQRVSEIFGIRNKYRAFEAYLTLSLISVGHMVAQVVEALRYDVPGLGLGSRWCH